LKHSCPQLRQRLHQRNDAMNRLFYPLASPLGARPALSTKTCVCGGNAGQQDSTRPRVRAVHMQWFPVAF
jgi:hypothetical protein